MLKEKIAKALFERVNEGVCNTTDSKVAKKLRRQFANSRVGASEYYCHENGHSVPVLKASQLLAETSRKRRGASR